MNEPNVLVVIRSKDGSQLIEGNLERMEYQVDTMDVTTIGSEFKEFIPISRRVDLVFQPTKTTMVEDTFSGNNEVAELLQGVSKQEKPKPIADAMTSALAVRRTLEIEDD